jgi:hypothetical protein
MRALLVSLTAGGLLAAGLAAPADAATQATGDVQVITPNDINRLHHTIRHANGTWQAWGTTDPVAADEPQQLASVLINGVDHIVYYATQTHRPPSFQPYQAIRDAAGNWSDGTVPSGMGYQAKVANLNGHLAVVTNTNGNEIKLSTQQGDGSWSAWETVPTGGDTLADYAVTANGGVLRVVVSNQAGTQIGDIDRAADGTWSRPTWTPFTGSPQTAVYAAQVGGDLQVIAVDYSGEQNKVWHTIRHANGSWDRFGDVEGAAGDLPATGVVSITNSRGELQLAFAAGDQLLHTIRHANGTWQRLGDVNTAAGKAYALEVTIAGE